jgi:ubiquinone/menaquinone biosynthesis C-methylase UbiE
MWRAIILILGFHGAAGQDTWKDVYSEQAWKDRDRWQRPAELIRHLNLKPGSQVADVGCHEGYMTMKLASAVGPNGKVFAVDIEQSKLDKLRKHLSDRGITNVAMVKGDEDDPRLSPGTLDAVIILDTYHEMDAHEAMLRHILNALKPGGRLVLCEAIAESRRASSREEQERKHELALSFALDDVRKAGFTVVYKADPFVDRIAEKGDTMWILVVKK